VIKIEGNSTIADVIRKFLIHIDTVKGKAKRTTQAYNYDLTNFFRFIKVYKKLIAPPENFYSNEPELSIAALRTIEISDLTSTLLKEITSDDLLEFMAHLNKYHRTSARPRKRYTATLNVFFKFIHQHQKLIETNPADLLEAPKIGKTIPIHLDLHDARQLLNVVKLSNNLRDFTIVTLFLNCGMRLSELVSINIRDIRDNKITITGKGNKQRTVYLNNACQMALSSYLPLRLKTETTDSALFLNKDSKRLGARSIQRMIEKYVKLANLDPRITVHKLRHTAATLMYQHGNVDIRALQAILGHEQLSTTEIYTHINEKRLQDAVESNPLSSS